MGYFSIGKAFSSGWGTLMERPWFFIGFQALLEVNTIIFQLFEGLLTGSTIVLGLPLAFVESGINQYISMKFLKGGFNLHYEKQGKPGVDPDGATWMKLYGAGLLRGILVVIGLILLIFPGIYFAIKYRLYNFVIIDRETGVLESLSEAGALAKGNWWKLFILSILTLLLTISGLLLFVVGIFFTSALAKLVWMHVYLQLKDVELDEDSERIINKWVEEQEKRKEQPVMASIIEEDDEEEEPLDSEGAIKRAASLDDLEL